eukprot:5177756-Amphidinium_carterae.1
MSVCLGWTDIAGHALKRKWNLPGTGNNFLMRPTVTSSLSTSACMEIRCVPDMCKRLSGFYPPSSVEGQGTEVHVHGVLASTDSTHIHTLKCASSGSWKMATSHARIQVLYMWHICLDAYQLTCTAGVNPLQYFKPSLAFKDVFYISQPGQAYTVLYHHSQPSKSPNGSSKIAVR